MVPPLAASVAAIPDNWVVMVGHRGEREMDGRNALRPGRVGSHR
ncbi:MAG: hypothetical protein AVDCRST_MAG59-4709 [uncultured Thermomicrobiales bacterium]|uniref:Uncharacterized protein n=1 Tax=uncultured Thermomicrobiales bacterium TaxID=1645740 RepID=A0A6J4VNF8_9BACT|nr:MAG: hypothetical protein AVDCRST_MAG59-4709 [uncultured Thermomicrobiales bacterium]